MEFPFKFNTIQTFAEEGRIIAKHENSDGAWLRIGYDEDGFETIIKNLKRAHRAAKRQKRQIEKFEKRQKHHKAINQD